MNRYFWQASAILMLTTAPGIWTFEAHAEEWRRVDLASRALGIVENHGTFWVCGSQEMIASSADGGTTWMTKHFDANGAALLAMGFADEKFGYAAGAGGVLLFTDDGGETWIAQSVDTSVIYAAAFFPTEDMA